MGLCSSREPPFRELSIPGVQLPPKSVYSNWQIVEMFFDFNMSTTKEVIEWTLKSLPVCENIKGLPKSTKDVCKPLQELFIKKIIVKNESLPADYKFFGNDNNVMNLKYLLSVNPFAVAALSLRTDEKSGKLVYGVASQRGPGDKETFFTKTIDCLDDSYHRVNILFDEVLNVTSFKVFKSGKEVNLSLEEACAQMLFLIAYFFEVVHTMIHIFHLLMVTGIADSTHPYELPAAWASAYFPNVFVKYEEVEKLLLSKNGVLTGGTYRADRDKVLAVCKEILILWGSLKTAQEFINKFLLQAVDPKRGDLIKEFIKRAEAIAPYAKDISDVFQESNSGKDLGGINQNLKLFFQNVGEDILQVDNLITWIELMSVTGLLHGSTLSLTRLLMTQPILCLYTESDKFSSLEADSIHLSSGTITGMEEKRHVFSDKIHKEIMNKFPNFSQILQKHSELNQRMKEEYSKFIRQNQKEFKEYGWILTDWCEDGFDGKQSTLTTYI